jgi:hypothetical protein
MIFNIISAIQIRHILFVGLCVIGLGSPTHHCTTKPPKTLFGEYVGIGCPAESKAGACLPTKPTDRVRLSRGKDEQATVSVKIAFDRGHSCELEGSATWSDGRFTIRADGLDPKKPCQLVLRISGSVLTLEDPEGLCREVYCGTRGMFDGARFKKKP